MILDVNAGAILIARTPDRIRARATGAFRTLNYGIRTVGASPEACSVRLSARARPCSTIGALLGILRLIWSPVIRLRALPELAGELAAEDVVSVP
jgi:hypothetical protein